MKKLFFLLILSHLFYACEKEVKSTEKIQKLNIEVVQEIDTTIVWVPKKKTTNKENHHSLVTISNQNYNVHTEYSSLENSSVDRLISNQTNFTVYKYRNYQGIIKITNTDILKFYKTIKKEDFLNETGKELQKKGILMSLEYQGFNKNEFHFIIRICQPETDYCSQIDYFIDLKGNTRKSTSEYNENEDNE